ncbi:tRNA isopentenyltransferase [Rhodocollybia butyracea]|uniref:tRNA isopentenyltransferase n=1 Tax=Rhodocollybia butyracea TaxID=206335 RepID=A0A9P5U9T7_9AGAR|nr:tRNA isopentenyltransferase [Rhodocollybia butyracea]
MKALRPIIAICGTTGVGKSNLAIELALQLAQAGRRTWNSAKIINADAMQVYAGMDIITNKVPLSERQGIEHVLMGFKSPDEQYVVGQWVKDALDAVEDAYANNQIPIVVGGTSYWIQHLLFPNRLAKDFNSEIDDRPSERSETSEELLESIKSLPPELLDLFNTLPDPAPSADTDPEGALRLYNLLKALDTSVAARWHWKDTRKVLRSLRIVQETGRRPSELIHEQSKVLLQPRFRTLCFWVFSKPEVLKPRLDLRIDKMLEQGLLDEVRALRAMSSAPNEATDSPPDYAFGIYQSIGYREFHKYLSLSHPTEEEFSEAVKSMKISTRQYAKRQTSWLRNKLLPILYAANDPVGGNREPSTFTYLLNATELGENWAINVEVPAVRITNAFLDCEPLPDPMSLSNVAREVLDVEHKNPDPNAVLEARRKIICPVCTTDPTQPFMVEEGKEYQMHLKSRIHKYRARKPLSAAEIEERKRQGRRKKEEECAVEKLDLNSLSVL